MGLRFIRVNYVSVCMRGSPHFRGGVEQYFDHLYNSQQQKGVKESPNV